MDIQQHSGKQISQEFPPSTYQRSQEYANYSIFPVVSAAEIINCIEEKQFPTTTTTSTNNNNIPQYQQNNNYLGQFEDTKLINNQNSTINSNNNNNNNNNNSNKNKSNKKVKDKSPKLFEDVLIPVTSSGKDGSLFTVLENVPVKRTHRRRSANVDKDSLKCHQCNTSNTPEWRKGPEGPATLCNACGLAYAKKQKLGLLGANNKSKAAASKKNSKGTTTRSRVFNELVVPTFPSTFPTLSNTTNTAPLPITDASSIKKSHTFHEYMTPLNSFYTGKPIKTTKTTTKQRSKSKIGKLIPSVHEQPQLNQQVQAAIEKSKLSNGFKFNNNHHQQQQQINSNTFNFSNINNNNNNIKNNTNNNNNTMFNNNNYNTNNNTFNNNNIINSNMNRAVFVNQINEGGNGGVNSFSPTNNHEHQIQFDFSANNNTTLVPNLLQQNGVNSLSGSNIYINDQNSYVPFINVNNNSNNNINSNNNSQNNNNHNINQNNNNNQSYSIQLNSGFPAQNIQIKEVNEPKIEINQLQPSIQVQPPIESQTQGQQSQEQTYPSIEVKNEKSPIDSEFGSSPTESFNGLSVNTPLECAKLLECSTNTSSNFNNGDYFGSMDPLVGIFGIHSHDEVINYELLPNSLL